MPKYKAPNHDDCSIVCPDGGYAIYIEPYGPCVKGCTSIDLEKSLRAVADNDSADFRSSGVIYQMQTDQVAKVFRNAALATNNRMMMQAASRLDSSPSRSLSTRWVEQKLDQVFANEAGQSSHE